MFFSSPINAIKKACSPQELKRLIGRFERRIPSVQDLGADVSCISEKLGRLADFGDEWARHEEEAAPRLPTNLINSKEAELEEILNETAVKSGQSQERKQRMDEQESEVAAVRDELASLTEQRQKAWGEYQRLDALCTEKEQLLKEKEDGKGEVREEMASLDREVAELHSRLSAVEEARLRSNPVVDSNAERAALLAVERGDLSLFFSNLTSAINREPEEYLRIKEYTRQTLLYPAVHS